MTADATKKCPMCGEEILAVAIKCKHCGHRLDEPVKKLMAKSGLWFTRRRIGGLASLIAALVVGAVAQGPVRRLYQQNVDLQPLVDALETARRTAEAESFDTIALSAFAHGPVDDPTTRVGCHSLHVYRSTDSSSHRSVADSNSFYCRTRVGVPPFRAILGSRVFREQQRREGPARYWWAVDSKTSEAVIHLSLKETDDLIPMLRSELRTFWLVAVGAVGVVASLLLVAFRLLRPARSGT